MKVNKLPKNAMTGLAGAPTASVKFAALPTEFGTFPPAAAMIEAAFLHLAVSTGSQNSAFVSDSAEVSEQASLTA